MEPLLSDPSGASCQPGRRLAAAFLAFLSSVGDTYAGIWFPLILINS